MQATTLLALRSEFASDRYIYGHEAGQIPEAEWVAITRSREFGNLTRGRRALSAASRCAPTSPTPAPRGSAAAPRLKRHRGAAGNTCIVLREGVELEPTHLMDHCVANMPYFAVPRYVEFFNELPRNPVGRVLKYALRERGVTLETWDREAAGYEVLRPGKARVIAAAERL